MDARSPPAAVDLVDYNMALVPPARKAAEQQEVHLEAAAAALIADCVSRLGIVDLPRNTCNTA